MAQKPSITAQLKSLQLHFHPPSSDYLKWLLMQVGPQHFLLVAWENIRVHGQKSLVLTV